MADALSNYGEFVKWQIGLSTATLAGLWAKFDLLGPRSLCWRRGLLLFAGLLLLDVFGGVQFLYWLNGIPNWKERIKEIVEETNPLNTLERNLKLSKRRKRFQKNLCDAEWWVPLWHWLTFWNFLVCVVVAFGLVTAALRPLQAAVKKDGTAAPRESARYTVNYSAVHLTARGREEAHTFLLDQWTGELWQMVCAPDGMVSFRRIRRLDFEGNIEPVPPAK